MDHLTVPHLHGATSRRAVAGAGLDDRRVRRAVRLGLVEPVGRSVLVLAGSGDTQRRRHAVAQLRVGHPAAFTGRSALWILGVADAPGPRPELLVPRTRRPLQGDDEVHIRRCKEWDQVGTRTVDGFCVVGVEWALLDLATTVVTDRRLADAIADADALRMTTVPRLAAFLHRRGRFPGRARARRVVEAMSIETSHSQTEGRVRRRLGELGFAPHPRPYAVQRDGRTIGEVDLAYPHDRYGAEIDGPFHLLAGQRARDVARDRALLPWRIARFPVDEVDADVDRVARLIIAGLDRVRAAQ